MTVMKDKLTLSILAILVIAATSCVKGFNEDAHGPLATDDLASKLVGGTDGEIIPGCIHIRLDEATTAAAREGRLGELAEDLFKEIDISSIRPALPFHPKNMEAARKYGLDQWFTVSFDNQLPPSDVAERIAGSSRIRSIQYNRFITPVKGEAVFQLSESMITKAAGETVSAVPFNDPYNRYQWNLSNDGSLGEDAVAGADIGVKDAWRLTGGDPSVIVAVIDDAIDTMHEDLKDALWRNEKEIGGEAGKDDDGNGFIDDKYGFNFVGCFSIKDATVNDIIGGDGKFEDIKYNALSPKEGTGHGTHVGGIVAATNNNGKGVSSVAGGTGNGDGVRLMSCQIVQGAMAASDAQTAAAFIYAADNGACIAQCSYGSPEIITDDETYISSSTLEVAALRYFLDKSNSNHESLDGNIAIFSSGNQGFDYSIYPGALADVISVTATGWDHLPGGYTNHGPGCNIAAPGGEIKGLDGNHASLILSTGTALAANAVPDYGLETGEKKSKNYVYMYGTSMACPHVSGVAALGVSYARKLGRKFSREEFTSLLLTSVHDIDQYLVSGTKKFFDPASRAYVDIPLNDYHGKMGTGSVDAWKFLMAIEGTPSVMVKVGEKTSIDLSRYCSPSATYSIDIDEASSTSLGLTGAPVIKDGFLEVECTKVGAGKITLSSSVGKDPEKEDGIGGMSYSREISIISRPFATQNGGWL